MDVKFLIIIYSCNNFNVVLGYLSISLLVGLVLCTFIVFIYIYIYIFFLLGPLRISVFVTVGVALTK